MDEKTEMRLVGVEQYVRLISAMRFYEKLGFRPIDVPWAVSKEAMNITRPAWAGPVTMMYQAGATTLCPVASAEQSYLQLQMDAKDRGEPITGRYTTLTPCFRNEPVVDDLHQPYFMKVELIDWDNTTSKNLNDMLEMAGWFFNRYLDTDIVLNTEPDPIGEIAFDIVVEESRIELGSYGIREHPRVGRWLYGTGVAEPRLSYAIEVDFFGRKKNV